MKISLVYISLSGNTASFIKRLSAFLQERHESVEIEQVDIKDMVKAGRPFYAMSQPSCWVGEYQSDFLLQGSNRNFWPTPNVLGVRARQTH